MKRKIIIILCIAGLFTQMSCSEDWLTPKPLSVFAPENVYIDEAGFEALLVTMRRDLKFEIYGDYSPLCMQWSYSDVGANYLQPDFVERLTPDVSQYFPFLTVLQEAYKNIRNTNTVISRIDDASWNSEAKRNAVLGEAYFFRSYWYYRLVNSYGDVPWVGEEVTGAKLDYYSTSRWAILGELQKNMEFAVQWLRDKSLVRPGEVSKGAGDHLLAKICLANGDFDGAIAAATRVINGPYELMKDRFGQDKDDPTRNYIWDLHRCPNKNLHENTETILATVDRASDPVGARHATGTYTMRSYNPSWWHVNIRDSEGKSAMLQTGKVYCTLGRGSQYCKMVPYYCYTVWNEGGYNHLNTTDMRRSGGNWVDIHQMFYTNPESVDFRKPINLSYCSSPSDTIMCWNPIQHYKVYVPESDSTTIMQMGANGDWYVFRLAETYLLRAEAYFYKGDLTSAKNDINVVRDRAHAPLINESGVTLDYIFDERARELYAETPRHSELVRASYIMAKLNRDGYSLANFANKNYFYDKVMKSNVYYREEIQFGTFGIARMRPHNVLWPIPNVVILANTLGVINQNEGYTGTDKNVPPLETID